VFERVEELGDLVVLLEGVAQVESLVDGVVVSPSAALTAKVAVALEVVDDLGSGALGDAHEVGDLPEAEIRCARDGEEHVGVVGEERPRAT